MEIPLTTEAREHSAVETTVLQPVVIQLYSYETPATHIEHHQASAGGTLISQLRNAGNAHRTPPGFSRWYFNFTATKPRPGIQQSS